jgi:DNA polymerase/3'-5' exonuclease PolX
MADITAKIIEALTILQKRDKASKDPHAKFKARAYGKAIDEIKVLGKPITKLEDIDGVPGVGEKIRKKIAEILETGGLKAAEAAKEEFQLDAVEVLTGVYGVGDVKAKSLISGGIKTIAQLRAAVAEDPDLLNDKQKIGLKHYEDIMERIPRSEMVLHEKLLLGELYENQTGIIVGSFRRGAESSGDIDVLITMDPGSDQESAFINYIDDLKEKGYMIEVLSQGGQKCLSVVRLGPGEKARRLDLLVIPNNQFPFALLYFTGSGDFNIAFRKHALKLGYTLNEHEMKLTGKVPDAKPVPPMRYEAEIFAFLGLKYKEPNQRIGFASVELLTDNVKAKVAEIKKKRTLKAKPGNK